MPLRRRSSSRRRRRRRRRTRTRRMRRRTKGSNHWSLLICPVLCTGTHTQYWLNYSWQSLRCWLWSFATFKLITRYRNSKEQKSWRKLWILNHTEDNTHTQVNNQKHPNQNKTTNITHFLPCKGLSHTYESHFFLLKSLQTQLFFHKPISHLRYKKFIQRSTH